MNTKAILLITCPDRIGLEATVSQFVHMHNGNIIRSEHHIDSELNVFCMRIEWDFDKFDLTKEEFKEHFSPLAKKYSMNWKVRFSDISLKMGILVSKYSHCLWDLLLRYEAGDINVDIPVIISNHPDLEHVAEIFSIPFYHLDVTKSDKKEKEIIALLHKYDVDFVVLARYMQILSSLFINEFADNIINIHHSFLPAFAGGRPYQKAYARGVKLIGATGHYATKDLDEGPIIEQDVIRVTHLDDIDSLKRKGKDLERQVLAKAVEYHADHRILVYENKTAVFR
ncbi:MAG: formyltetrahydrofolate deformylase [Verrucomicrobiota bacterium]|nr:formyltetrahydrofolate deformylase [Verrucomicrobiota bacterium]